MSLKEVMVLLHGNTPYDPVKAHEYYIRTRKLKGHRPGRVTPVRAHVRKSPTYTVTTKNKQFKLTEQQLVEQRAYAAKRVAEIKIRLKDLSTKLHQLMAEAKKKKAAANQKPTAATKQKSAQKSKQYRQKHKQVLANKAKAVKAKTPKKSATHKDPVVELENKIIKVKNHLTQAIETQRALIAARKNG